jgi:hypothetical protein
LNAARRLNRTRLNIARGLLNGSGRKLVLVNVASSPASAVFAPCYRDVVFALRKKVLLQIKQASVEAPGIMGVFEGGWDRQVSQTPHNASGNILQFLASS